MVCAAPDSHDPLGIPCGGKSPARLAGHPATVAVASVPQGVVETFYLARFGGRHLDKQELQQVEQALARLRTALAATRRR